MCLQDLFSAEAKQAESELPVSVSCPDDLRLYDDVIIGEVVVSAEIEQLQSGTQCTLSKTS